MSIRPIIALILAIAVITLMSNGYWKWALLTAVVSIYLLLKSDVKIKQKNTTSKPFISVVDTASPYTKEKSTRLETFDSRLKDCVPMSLRFTYPSSSGISEREVDVTKRRESSYIHGYCHARKANRTFKIDKIIGSIVDCDTGEVFSRFALKDKLGYKKRKTSISDGRGEILFTGFNTIDRDELMEFAIDNNFIVRSRVTKNLDYLCKGSGRAPAKVRDAEAIGASVISEKDFLDML